MNDEKFNRFGRALVRLPRPLRAAAVHASFAVGTLLVVGEKIKGDIKHWSRDHRLAMRELDEAAEIRRRG